MGLEPVDYALVFIYAAALLGLATWISLRDGKAAQDTSDYFLAGRALPWWAIGSSLIAANISAEQVIGMSGSGYAIGLAIASYEWMSAITLLIVAKFFLPIFIRQRIDTMPQFLEQRYNASVRTVMAVFWLGVFTFINLTSILWLGALTIETVTGFDLFHAMLALAGFALLYSVYGGLRAVALTDIVQVVMLVLGGLLIAWITLDEVGGGAGALAGFAALIEKAPQKFNLILAPTDEGYQFLPGLSVLLGGLWVMNLSYWGFNQYIIQRALGAISIEEAQKGLLFAAFLKLLMPLLVVLPGIAAFVLLPDLERPDAAYPTLLGMAPAGARGVILAALIAAIVSSLGSMMNSIATIFTLDLYRPHTAERSERHYVAVGRIAATAALVVAVVSARPLLGDADQAFQWLQEFTGFFTPGVVTLFLLGLFWKRTNAAGAFSAAIGSVMLSLLFKWWLPDMPFMNRVALVFLACAVLGVVVSLLTSRQASPKALDNAQTDFGTSRAFNVGAAIIMALLIFLYWFWW